MDKPDRALPETDEWTFTNMILTYFTDHEALGFGKDRGAGNLALDRPVAVSATEPGAGAERAVDGDTGTHWSAGAGPPQWIEITLDEPSTVGSMRLIPAQYPDGETTHRLFGWIDGDWALLETLTGPTSNGVAIVVMPEAPWERIERVRIETTASPSWVAWLEIEVLPPP
jgi:hypothetical protein